MNQKREEYHMSGMTQKSKKVSKYPNESWVLKVSLVENEPKQGRLPAPLKESERGRVPRYPNESIV